MKLTVAHIIFFFILLSCSASKKPDSDGHGDVPSNEVVLTEEQFKSAGIQVGHFEQRSLSGTIRANGMLDVPPQNLVTISAPLGGFVKKTDLLQGMKVSKGQLLATLEHPDYIQLQQDYLDLRSQLEFQHAEFGRQQELARENVSATKALQQAQSIYNSLKAKVMGLEAKLRMINIDTVELNKGAIQSSIPLFSSISGYITQVNVNVGMYVNPTDVMFRIIDNTHLHAEAQVFEKDITKLRVGQTVRFTLTKDSKPRTAKVYLIGKEITAERTVRVHCHLDQEDASLIPGMYFNAVIETDNQTVNALPEAAIVNFGGKEYVFIVKNASARQFEFTEISKGNSDDQYVEVVLPEGMLPSTPVVTTGAYELLSFLKNKGE